MKDARAPLRCPSAGYSRAQSRYARQLRGVNMVEDSAGRTLDELSIPGFGMLCVAVAIAAVVRLSYKLVWVWSVLLA